jgi:hypothetical protein
MVPSISAVHEDARIRAAMATGLFSYLICLQIESSTLQQWYSTFFVSVPPDIISLQLFTPKVYNSSYA